MEYSPYGGRFILSYKLGRNTQERTDDVFVPISAFAHTEFDGAIQFVAPNSSDEKLQSILSECATDPNIIATGNNYIVNNQYDGFIQWLGQQDESAIPPLCADDLQLVAETVASRITCDTTIVSGDVTGLINAIDSANNTPEADTICLEAGTPDPTGYVSSSCRYSGSICETLTPSTGRRK